MEEVELARLTTALGAGLVLRTNAVDYLVWKPTQAGGFKVHFVYDWELVSNGPIQRSVDLI